MDYMKNRVVNLITTYKNKFGVMNNEIQNLRERNKTLERELEKEISIKREGFRCQNKEFSYKNEDFVD